MKKTFKYRLLGNKQVFDKADRWLGLCHDLYNSALAERIYAFDTPRTLERGVSMAINRERGRDIIWDGLESIFVFW